MKVHFYLRFHTKPGQELYISGNTRSLGSREEAKALGLSYMNDEFWHGSIEADPEETREI